jgi:hypothetical protein
MGHYGPNSKLGRVWQMGDGWLNDLMIYYNEKEIFRNIDNEKIKKRFQEMKKRRMLLIKKLIVRYIIF